MQPTRIYVLRHGRWPRKEILATSVAQTELVERLAEFESKGYRGLEVTPISVIRLNGVWHRVNVFPLQDEFVPKQLKEIRG